MSDPAYPASWPSMKNALADQIAAELEAHRSGWTVTWEDQDAPAPGYPRASLRVRGLPTLEGRPGTESRTPAAAPSQLDILRRTSGRFVLGVTLHPGQDDPGALEAIRLGVFSIATAEAFRAAGLVVVGTLLAEDVSSRFAGRWEYRYVLDLEVRVSVEQRDENQPWIETTGQVDMGGVS